MPKKIIIIIIIRRRKKLTQSFSLSSVRLLWYCWDFYPINKKNYSLSNFISCILTSHFVLRLLVKIQTYFLFSGIQLSTYSFHFLNKAGKSFTWKINFSTMYHSRPNLWQNKTFQYSNFGILRFQNEYLYSHDSICSWELYISIIAKICLRGEM